MVIRRKDHNSRVEGGGGVPGQKGDVVTDEEEGATRKALPTSEGLSGEKEPVNDRGRVRAIQESVRHGVSSVLLQAVRAGANYGGEVVLLTGWKRPRKWARNALQPRVP